MRPLIVQGTHDPIKEAPHHKTGCLERLYSSFQNAVYCQRSFFCDPAAFCIL